MSTPEIPLDRWNPLSVKAVVQLLSGAPFRWAFAGGYAIEQFLGIAIRDHADMDVMVFRDEQQHLHDWLQEWSLWAADPPGSLRKWDKGQYLPIGIHDIWSYHSASDSWHLQIMLIEVEAEEWYYRRNPAIRGNRHDLIVRYNCIPCIRAEIQLLYKAHHPRQKDEMDFQAALPLLNSEAKHWLSISISQMYPQGHPWLKLLT